MSGEPELPAGVQTAPEALAFWAERTPGALALERPGEPPMSFAALWDATNSLAGALGHAGLGRHDRVVLLLPDGPTLAATLLGTMCAAIAVPFPDTLTSAELAAALQGLRATAAIVDPALPEVSREVLTRNGIAAFDLRVVVDPFALTLTGRAVRSPGPGNPPQPDDFAVVSQTSGTTGRPKRVPESHLSAVHGSRTYRDAYGMSRRDRLLAIAPLSMSLGKSSLFHAAFMGATTIFPPSGDLVEIWKTLDTKGPTWLEVSAGFLELLARFLRDRPGLAPPTSLHHVRVTAAPLSPEVCRELEGRLGAPLLPSYSTSETGRIATTLPPPAPAKPGSAGVPDKEVRFVDETGQDVPAGAEGEILVHAPLHFAGYLDDPELTAAVLTPDGWYRAGDIGYLDADGFLFLTGRASELINRGGVKVAPAEVDAVLLAHPAVRSAAVFAVPDERLGQDLVAAVVLDHVQSLAAWELRQWLLERLSPHKTPRRIWFVSELPHTASGKVQRGVLASQYLASTQRS